jgi:hypothetical protein
MPFFKKIFQNYFKNLNISIKPATGIHLNKKIHSNFYFQFSHIHIQLALFYERGDFYWIGKDKTEKNSEFKWFGDKNRGIN